MKKLLLLAVAGVGAAVIKRQLDARIATNDLWSAARSGTRGTGNPNSSGSAATPPSQVWAQATDTL